MLFFKRQDLSSTNKTDKIKNNISKTYGKHRNAGIFLAQ